MKLYKILDKNGKSCNGGISKWFLPEKCKDGTWKVGKWMPLIQGKLIPCKNGYHLCRENNLILWLNETIYEAEYRRELIEDDDKVIVRQARLIRQCETWNERTTRLFACWCVRNTPLKNGGTVWRLLKDERSKNAVKIAEEFANGKATKEELDAAWDTARDTAWAAAWDAAWAAAGAAAGAAAWDTAWDTARDTAWAAAWDAAWAAAGDAARDTAWAAAWDAAWAAQTKELMRILNEKEG